MQKGAIRPLRAIKEFLAQDYAIEAKTWGATRKHMNVIADVLTAGS